MMRTETIMCLEKLQAQARECLVEVHNPQATDEQLIQHLPGILETVGQLRKAMMMSIDAWPSGREEG